MGSALRCLGDEDPPVQENDGKFCEPKRQLVKDLGNEEPLSSLANEAYGLAALVS